jgi:hypothetical protein
VSTLGLELLKKELELLLVKGIVKGMELSELELDYQV